MQILSRGHWPLFPTIFENATYTVKKFEPFEIPEGIRKYISPIYKPSVSTCKKNYPKILIFADFIDGTLRVGFRTIRHLNGSLIIIPNTTHLNMDFQKNTHLQLSIKIVTTYTIKQINHQTCCTWTVDEGWMIIPTTILVSGGAWVRGR